MSSIEEKGKIKNKTITDCRCSWVLPSPSHQGFNLCALSPFLNSMPLLAAASPSASEEVRRDRRLRGWLTRGRSNRGGRGEQGIAGLQKRGYQGGEEWEVKEMKEMQGRSVIKSERKSWREKVHVGLPNMPTQPNSGAELMGPVTSLGICVQPSDE